MRLLQDIRVIRDARRLRASDARGVHVLTYHGVVERFCDERLERNFHTIDAFREQVGLLRRIRVISVEELSDELHRRSMPRRGVTCAVTFDDGYQNNLVAAEMLGAAGLPWTLFISTGPIAEGGTIWTAQLSLILLAGRVRALRVLDREWQLESREAREAAFQSVRVAFKALPARERLAAMQALRAQLPDGELSRLLEEHPAFRTMSWAEVRGLATSGVTIGSHGVDHELHHAYQPEPVRRAELSLSKERIEAQTGRACRFFAYPNGTTNDRSPSESLAAGYDLAFTTEAGAVGPGSECGALPRIQPGVMIAGLMDQLMKP